MKLSTIDQAVEALKRGELIIVMDDENRENEGDFIGSAEDITSEKVNFMLKYGRGQTCVPMLPSDCDRLELPQMVQNNTAPLGTQFTIAVDHRDARTGITAQEKALTIKALADPKTKVSDLVRPGHIFPLRAKEGGVLRRAGHTEATIDLLRLAGKRPCGVLIEILGEDIDEVGAIGAVVVLLDGGGIGACVEGVLHHAEFLDDILGSDGQRHIHTTLQVQTEVQFLVLAFLVGEAEIDLLVVFLGEIFAFAIVQHLVGDEFFLHFAQVASGVGLLGAGDGVIDFSLSGIIIRISLRILLNLPCYERK